MYIFIKWAAENLLHSYKDFKRHKFEEKNILHEYII